MMGKVVSLAISGKKAAYNPETFKADLQNYVNLPYKDPQKIHIIKNVSLTATNGGDITTSDVGYGVTVPSGYNAINQTFRIVGAGDCLAKQIAKFNTKEANIFLIDDQGIIFGDVYQKADGTLSFTGYESFLMMSETIADGTNVYILNLNVYYGVNYNKERKNRHAIVLDAIPDGLIGVMLKKGATTATASVVDICSGDDYTSLFGNDWDARMFVNSAGTAPTTVTYNSATGLLTFVPTGSYKVQSANILSTSNILGLEGANKFVALS
jgi:hypothetical protein